MNQVSRVLSTYSADLFGINSVLYELGGLVVMHDASGCNSTYNTHDEPRWYEIDSMIYISGLIENDVILGNDEKLIEDICEAAEETNPKFIAISAALIPLFMSTDMKGIAKIVEKRTGIPTFGFTTNAMDTYVLGGNMVYRELLERFCQEIPQKFTKKGSRVKTKINSAYQSLQDDSPSELNSESNTTISDKYKVQVNLLGVTPLDFSVVGNVESIRSYFENIGCNINCCMTMGCTLEEIKEAYKADVNIVCSSIALEGAKVLQAKYGIPYITGLPIGASAKGLFPALIDKAIYDNSCYRISEGVKDKFRVRDRAISGTWLIGEAVTMASLRYCLEHDLRINNVHILCPTQLDAGLLKDGDVMARDEADIELVLKGADLVIADPIYRRILTKDENGRKPHFINFPHEAYSGRMYRSHIPNFLSEGFEDWLKPRLACDEGIGINDIMKVNEPFNKHPKY